MSLSRIKTIAIVALILINAFFGTLILVDSAGDARAERRALEGACNMLRSDGIMLDPDNVKVYEAIRTMKTARVDEVEAQIAQAVLGQTTMTVQGVIYRYENTERGIAEFYSGGDFEIRLNEDVITNEDGSLKTVQTLLHDMNFETSSQTVSKSWESEIVTVVSANKGVSIFNCKTEFVFSEGSLRTIKGRYISGVEIAEDGAEIMQVGRALLDFLIWVRQGNSDCKEIYRVEAGYQHSITGTSGSGAIAPAWLIETDTGRYIITDATGAVFAVDN